MNAIQVLIEQIRQQGDPVLAGQAALEQAEIRDVLVQLLEDYWHHPKGVTNDVYCRYCGAHAWRGMDIQHSKICPVLRGRALLK